LVSFFSRDTDPLPAVETVFELKAAHVEVATWYGTSQLRFRRALGRLRRDLRRIGQRDFFPPPQRDQARAAVDMLAASLDASCGRLAAASTRADTVTERTWPAR
jgi:hypothetical protein